MHFIFLLLILLDCVYLNFCGKFLFLDLGIRKMADEGGKDDCLLSSGRLMSDSGDDLMLGGSSCNGDLMNNSSILESELELLLL